MTDSPLPEPDSLVVKIHADREGCSFEIRTTGLTCAHGGESIHDDPGRAMSPNVVARRAQKWIDRYRAATNRERCRMCGYDWSAVKRALTRRQREEAQA
ncbi:MAG: hypothetical protein AAGL98_08350 [Planctomycetota bacterium]